MVWKLSCIPHNIDQLTMHIIVRQHTNVPVPEVYSWSSTPSNPVGAEYIVMEKAAGVPVFTLWGKMSQSSKLGLIKQLTMFERKLSSIQLPAYGSLYLRASCGNLPGCELLNSEVVPSASYCVGRISDRSYVPDDCEQVDDSKIDLGPCKYLIIWLLVSLLMYVSFQGLRYRDLVLRLQSGRYFVSYTVRHRTPERSTREVQRSE
jgi:hypothetical protein